MNASDYIAYFWLLPVTFQIVLPIIILCGWSLAKLPALLLGDRSPKLEIAPATVG